MKATLGLLETARERTGPHRTNTGERSGKFAIAFTDSITLLCIASDGSGWHEAGLRGEPFEHVSVSAWEQTLKGVEPRIPTWEEMAWVKDRFFDEEETVIQIHPPRSQYVNWNPNVLHLWRPTQTVVPLPPMITIAPARERPDV